MNLMNILKNSFLILSFGVLIGCTTTNPSGGPTPFPPSPQWVEYTSNPIVSFNKTEKTYVVTQEFMYNMVSEHSFLDAILKWKSTNKID